MELVCRVKGHDVHELAWQARWSSNGKLVASCGSDRKICIFSFDSKGSATLQTTLSGVHNRTVRSICWSPECLSNVYLSSASFDASGAVWAKDDDDFTNIFTLEGHENELKGIDWSSNGQYIATCSRDKTVWIWEFIEEDGEAECAEVLGAHNQDVKSVKFHPDCELLVSCGYDNLIKIHQTNQEDWTTIQTLSTHSDTVWNVDFNKDGSRFCSCSADGTFRIYHAETKSDSKHPQYRLTHTISGQHDGTLLDISWCKSSNRIATACNDNFVRIFSEFASGDSSSQNTTSFFLMAKFDCKFDVNSVHWNPKIPTYLVSAIDDGSILFFNVPLSSEESEID